MSKASSWLAVAVIAALAVFTAAGRAGPAAAAQELTLRAGSGETGYSVDLFLPDTAFVNAGDTVRWSFPWFEPHSVTFGTPTGDPTAPTHAGTAVVEYGGTGFVSSGLLFGGPGTSETFAMKFTVPGTYAYVCVIHPAMTGTVTVVKPGQQVDNQGSVDNRGEGASRSALQELKALARSLSARPVAVTGKTGGGKKYTLEVGGGSAQGTLMQFFPPAASIQPNDSIEFVSFTPAPHTVTFGPVPPGNPFALPPSKPAAAYDGTGLWNSGIIGIGLPAGQRFEMTFAKAGSYAYICILHANQGMVGTVSVATPAPPAPPATGTGLEVPQVADPLAITLGVLLLMAALAFGTALTARAASRR